MITKSTLILIAVLCEKHLLLVNFYREEANIFGRYELSLFDSFCLEFRNMLSAPFAELFQGSEMQDSTTLLTVDINRNNLRCAISNITSDTFVFSGFLHFHGWCCQRALCSLISWHTAIAKLCICNAILSAIIHLFTIQVPRDFRRWLTECSTPYT